MVKALFADEWCRSNPLLLHPQNAIPLFGTPDEKKKGLKKSRMLRVSFHTSGIHPKRLLPALGSLIREAVIETPPLGLRRVDRREPTS